MTSLPSSPTDRSCPEYQAVQTMYSTLCNGLHISLLIPDFISRGVIDFTEREEIQAERTDTKKTEKLLGYLMKELSVNCCDRFNRFMAVLRSSSNCSYLAKRVGEALEHHWGQTAAHSMAQLGW